MLASIAASATFGLCIAVLGGCTQQSTDDLLSGNFLTSGQSRIDLLSPSNNSIASQNPVFAWSAKAGLGRYKVEISPFSDFSQVILSKEVSATSYTLLNSDLVGVTQLNPVQYFWRVSAAQIKNNLQSAANTIQILETNVYYVDTSSSSSVTVGNKTSPFKTIQSAIGTADAARNSNAGTSITIKVAKGTYYENIALKAGISLYGGFDPATWSRNISGNPTYISATLSMAISGASDITTAYVNTTVFDGFTVYALSLTGNVTYVIYLNNASPTISNNTLVGGSGIGTYGILAGGGTPIISNNSISGGSAGGAGAIVSYGVFLSGSTPILANNTIHGGSASTTSTSATSYGIYSLSSFPVMTNNTVYAGSVTGGTTASYGVFSSGSQGTVTNNIIYTSAGTSQYCYYENSISGDNPRSFQNNLLVGCGTALYYDNATTSRTLESDLNTAANINQGGAGTVSGNLGPTSVPTINAINFSAVNSFDWHLTVASPINIRCGGKNTNSASCGSAGSSSCGNVIADRDGLNRTASLTGTCVTPTNSGAAGYSIGAFELD